MSASNSTAAASVPAWLRAPRANAAQLKMLVYGVPGTGKTYLAGTAGLDERLSPIVFIDAEGGLRSLDRMFPDHEDPRILTVRVSQLKGNRAISMNGADPIDPNQPLGLGNVLEWLLLASTKQYVKTVVIDSMTEIQKLSMAAIQADEAAHGRDASVPTQQMWFKNTESIRSTVRAFRDLPYHLIVTCHEQTVQDQTTGRIDRLPSLSGKLAYEIQGFFDIVAQLTTTSVTGDGAPPRIVRHMSVQPIGGRGGKDRTGALGVELVDPTMTAILDRINA
jgi:hypothetical protein